jgi:hypothetical protein
MRRTANVTIQPSPNGRENRDAGKTFVITEAPALQAEEWGLRAIMALGTSGIVVPQEIADAGLVGVALIGYQAFMGAKFEEVRPLWQEMLSCISFQPSPGISLPFNGTLIEEVSTLLELRKQILELHTGFTVAELAQKFQVANSAMKLNSPTTSTSPEP